MSRGVRLAVGPVRLTGVADPQAFEAALRDALARLLADPALAQVHGVLQLGGLRVATPADASALEAAAHVVEAVRQACRASLGREVETGP